MRIDVTDLRRMADILFDHLESLGERTIEIEDDYYWTIDEKQLYDPTQSPTDFSLGQLTDDWQELRKVLDSQKTVSYSLVWFASLLRAIGQKVVR
jgi:hypothetical protein